MGGANQPIYLRNAQKGLTKEEPRPIGVEARKVASTAQSDHTHPNAAPAAPSTTFTTTTATSMTTTRPESELKSGKEAIVGVVKKKNKCRL